MFSSRSLGISFIFAVCALTSSAQTPTTFANPLDLDYRFMPERPSRREAADPLIILVGDDYFLFASKSGGYWHSSDMRKWTLIVPEGYPLEEYAPAVVSIDGRIYYTAHKSKAIYTTDDIKAGKWRKVADIDSYSDPAFFLDDDKRLYLYHGAALNGSISAVELDYRNGFKLVAGPTTLMSADYAHHGWERSGPDNLGANMTEGFRIGPYIEGSWMTKYGGTYYLQYAAPGTVWKSYADGVYTSGSPMGEFVYAPYSPFSYKPGGFAGSAGHSGLFQDKGGRWWRITTLDISVIHKFERRLGIFPAGFDADGVLRTDTYLGDYPQFFPGERKNPLDSNRTPWMLLSGGKHVTASSELVGHSAALAVDEDIRTAWSAKTANAGEWLQIDLERKSTLHAVQINLGEVGSTALDRASTGASRYRVDASLDAKAWTPLVDASESNTDAPHAYLELAVPVQARFVRLTNVRVAGGGIFAVQDLRIFGVSSLGPPPVVGTVHMTRRSDDQRSAMVSWTRVPRATGYIVRFGLSPQKLYSNYQVGDVDSLALNNLNAGVNYFFAIDAFGEGGIARGTHIEAAPARPL